MLLDLICKQGTHTFILVRLFNEVLLENFRYNAQEAAVVPCRVVAQCCHHKGMAQWAMSGPKRITMWVQNEKAVNLRMHR